MDYLQNAAFQQKDLHLSVKAREKILFTNKNVSLKGILL